MGKHKFLWAIFFALLLGGNSSVTQAQPQTSPPVNQGAGTFIPGAAQGSPAVQQQLAQPGAPTNIGTIPTPDTAPPPGGGIIAPSTIPTQPSVGQYRNERGEVKIAKMFLDRYKNSVVRVTARDMAGNELSRAMGVGVGRNSQFIATPLSLILGNTQQWADKIEITHAAGNKYHAKIALIDEEKNLVLLAPEASPAPIPYARDVDERPQVDIFTISFENGPGGAIDPRIHRGRVDAVNSETGLLSVSTLRVEGQAPVSSASHAGTAIINPQGELVGMLLPEGRGVLSSALQKMAVRAQQNSPIEPILTGTILGRGVLVDPSLKGAFPTITTALEAIKKGEAPKADASMYLPARNRMVAPKESDKVVVKVMPGTYKVEKPLVIPSDLSLSGSGPDRTVLLGTDPEKPVVLFQDVENSMLSGFRITPAPMQNMKAPSVIISKSRMITLLGTVVEAKGGVGVWAHESIGVNVQGNAFARGNARALSCDRSTMVAEGNGFAGDWPIAVSVDRNCSIDLQRNFFYGNKNSISISSLARRVNVQRNTFVRGDVAVKVTGNPTGFTLNDNLFFECAFGLTSTGTIEQRRMGRNAVWRTKMQAGGRPLNALDLVRTEPKFMAPENYDFRLRPGQAQLSTAVTEPGADLGAFQREEHLGTFTQQAVRSLAAALGEPNLPTAWGLSQ